MEVKNALMEAETRNQYHVVFLFHRTLISFRFDICETILVVLCCNGVILKVLPLYCICRCFSNELLASNMISSISYKVCSLYYCHWFQESETILSSCISSSLGVTCKCSSRGFCNKSFNQ